MHFDLTQEQQMLRDSVRGFMSERYTFEQQQRFADSAAGFSEDCWEQYAELGWLGLGLPEENGGLGLSLLESALVLEEFGRALALEPYATTAILCARIVERGDNPGWRAELLPAIAAGQARLALAHTERHSRYAVGDGIDTVAQRVAGGYTVTGEKFLVLDAPAADRLIVSAGLDGTAALFLVDATAPGLAFESYPTLDGGRAADMRFHAVFVPDHALLVGPARAAAVLEEAVDRLILAKTAELLGGMEAALALTADYLKLRRQFGRSLGSFQALQHRMAEIFVEVQEARSMFYYGLAQIDAQAQRRRGAVSAVKAMVAQAAKFACGQCIQLHGGIGMTAEYRVGHYFKRALAYEKMYGDTDHHLERFAAATAESSS